MSRIGLGVDVHAFVENRPLVVGGVEVAYELGLGGHSDADVLSHAVADALLGAAGLGDLGEVFPGTPEWQGASSLRILARTAALVRDAGFRVESVDATVIAQAPKLGPHRKAMRANVARALSVDEDVVSIKATTTDGLGLTGRGEGMAAMAVALLSPNEAV
jgi:2-C-methyl-D-erythritol 2,4-cyclodiphosphate synthase